MITACPICIGGGDVTLLRKCAACMKISYCSRAHQREHWIVHKNDCCPFKVTIGPIMGKQLIANWDLEPNTLILEEKPLIYFPYWTGRQWCCLSCGLNFKGQPRLCQTCQWPVCSTNCEQVPIHKDNECFVFATQNVSFSTVNDQRLDSDVPLIANIIEFIRGLRLKQLNQKLFQDLLNEVYNNDKLHNEDFVKDFRMDISLLKAMINVQDLMGCELDEKELLQFRVAAASNNFSHNEDNNRSRVNGVYLKSSRMNHSCSPNVVEIVLPQPPFPLKVRTSTFVRKGTPLTFNYFDEELELQCRRSRHEIILDNWGFNCQCQRCSDATELGSYLDGVRCTKCRPFGFLPQIGIEDEVTKGFFLPVIPLDFEENAKWECNRCRATMSYRVIKTIEEHVHDEFHRAIDGIDRSGENAYQLLETFERKCKLILHPNHFILVAAAQAMIQLLEKRNRTSKLTLRDFDRTMEKRLYLLSILKKVTPGISAVKADILTDLCRFMLYATETLPFDKTKMLDLLKSSLAYNEEASVFFDQDKNFIASREKQFNELTLLQKIIQRNIRRLERVERTPDVLPECRCS